MMGDMKKNNKAMGTNRYKDIVGGVLRSLLIMAVLIPFAEGCNYKDLVVDNTHMVTINVVYDWENALDAYPDGMCIYFYNLSDGSYYDRWDFSATKAAGTHVQGGQIKLPAGSYSVITYNNDTEAVYFSGTDKFSTHTAFTTENTVYNAAMGNTGAGMNSKTNSRADTDLDDFATDNTVINNPSMMWGVTALDVVITEDTISYTTTRASGSTVVKSADADMTLTLYPHELVATYTYDVINVHNIKYAYLVFGKLSGMGSTLNFSTAELGPETYPVAFDSKLTRGDTDEDGQINGSFYTFGNVGSINYMVFYAMLTNGENWYNIYDVTDQVKTADDPMHVHILIDGMELPVAISDGDGFDPSVDDWQDQNFDLPLTTGNY